MIRIVNQGSIIMKKVLLIICLSFLNLQACYTPCRTIGDANVTNSAAPKISSETAVIIARGYLCFDYNLKNYNISVIEKPDTWEIRFLSKDSNFEGFGPIIFISKMNGELVYLVNSK